MRVSQLTARPRPRGVGLAVGACAAGLLLAAIPVRPASAAHAPPGATSCSGCHAAQSEIPPIAGRPAAETVSAMADYRSGARPATVMDRIAKGFSDAETKAIADWLAAQTPPLKP